MGELVSAWRYLTADGVGAAAGLAVDEALMLQYQQRRPSWSEGCFRLYTYRSHCALIGRYQSLEDEVDLDRCARRGLQVSRRPTGGGAILMGAGQLGVAITTRAPEDVAPRSLLHRYAEGVIAGLARLGIASRFRGKNDLEVAGRKIAGLGLYLDERGALLFHASVLADLDVPLMLEVLRIPGAKLADKGIDLVADRVTTVSLELGRATTGSDLREAVKAGLVETLGLELVQDELDAAEGAHAEELARRKYSRQEWIRVRSPLRDGRGTSVLKTPEGLLRIHVAVHGKTIKSALIEGDFNTIPAGLSHLEASLRWSHAHPKRINELVEETLSQAVLRVPTAAVADAIWEAATHALERERHGHPARASGSCYVPELEP